MKLIAFVLPFGRSRLVLSGNLPGIVVRASGCAAVGLLCLLSAFRAWSADCVSPPAGLVAWWRGEGNANDMAGTNNGTLLNGAAFAPGKVGQAFSFDGVDDVVQVPSSPALSFASNSPITVELWAYRTGSAPVMHFIGKRIACGGNNAEINYQMAFDMTRGGLNFGSYWGGTTNSGLDMPMTNWTHLAGTFDGSNFCLYVNGIVRATGTGALGPPNTAPLLIGGSDNCAKFAGLIDEVSVYNRALTTNEIAAIYNASSAGKCGAPPNCIPPPSGLVAWWPGEGNASDRVGTNSGTLQNGVTFVTGEVGQAFLFEGTQSFAQVSDSLALSPHVGTLGEMTLEAWVRIERLPQVDPGTGWPLRAIVVKGGNPVWEYGLEMQTDARPIFLLWLPSGNGAYAYITAANPVTTNQWHHLVGTLHKGIFARIYVDGQLAGETTSFSGDTAHGSSLLYFGRRGDGLLFDGAVDEVSLYNRALSGAEIAAIYNAGSAGKCTTPTQPYIFVQPTNQAAILGGNAAFSVIAGGTPPLSYQWQFNSTNILNVTNAIYSIPSVGTNNVGNYSVVVTNAAGSATSSNAALTVVLSPRSRTNYASSTATFTVTAFSPESLNYQWQKNGTNLVEGGRLSGTTNSTLTITGVLDTDAASYTAVVSDAYTSVTTSNAVLTVIDPPVITAQPTNVLVLLGTNVAFGVSLAGTAPLRYQWRFNGTNILNATNAIYSIPSVGTNNAGNYAVVITNMAGSMTSSNAALTVVLSPRSQTNYASSTATLTATAFSPELLNYQWQKNGTNLVEGGKLSGTTNSTLTIASISDADAASYSAVVSDATGSVTTSSAVLTVNDYLFIASQPQSQTVGVGSNVTFSVTVYGAPPFVFQWYFNGTPLGSPSTGTNFSYTLTNVGTNQAGKYSVLVVNDYGSVTSSNAVLTVKVFPPNIGLQPFSQSVMMGGSASFSVSVTGTAPFGYQWRFNGINLLNATNAAYAIQAVDATNTGNYSVVVTNLAGSATSSNALLTVIVPPTLALKFLAGYPLLDLNGMLSSNFVVQYSTNLAGSNWMNLLSLTNLPASPYLFLDPAGDGEAARFYRAFMR